VGLKNDVEVSLLLRDRETVERGIQILPFYQNIIAEGVDIYIGCVTQYIGNTLYESCRCFDIMEEQQEKFC
jgi:hypothetical protein